MKPLRLLALALALVLAACSRPVPLYCDEDTPPGLVECYELDIEQYVRAIHGGRPEGREPDRMERRPDALLGPDRFRITERQTKGRTGD